MKISKMKLYNTLTRQKEPLKPLGEVVSVYTCGPTVYLDPHIGNWRSFIFYDTLIRVLQLCGYKTNHVINITDVGHLVSDADEGEDKLAKQAALERKTAWEIAEFYTDKYLKERRQLNMLEPNHMPKATDHIQDQIDMVKALEAAGVTYKIDDGIYFDTSKFKNYGQLGKLDLAGQEAGARVETNDQKRNPQDFALWKFSPADAKRDMEWDSPWGKGFPGWHLECSAMAKKYLGNTLDIHAGGVDHIPVHHTNEIAQSEVANGVQFANIWLHGEFMKVDGQRMGKSLGNMYTLSDLEAKGFEPLAFRLLVLQGHYRTETNFSWDNLGSAQTRLNNLRFFAEQRWQSHQDGAMADFTKAEKAIKKALEDDLNTPQALEILSGAISQIETKGLAEAKLQEFNQLLDTIDQAFGLNLVESTPDVDRTTKDLLAKRAKARSDKDFKASDQLRDSLKKSGVNVLDTDYGQVWRR